MSQRADQRIAVLGLPKTGTTAAYEAIKAALPEVTSCFFEPKTEGELHHILSLSGPVLVKFMFNKIGAMNLDITRFNRTVAMVRDPRDYLVSALLYRFDNQNLASDENRLRGLKELFAQKEHDARSISLMSLYDAISPGGRYDWDGLQQSLAEYAIFLQSLDGAHILKYEDFVDGRLEETSSYLGFSIQNDVELSGWTSKIARKKAKGDWKNWFTPEDDQIRPYIEPFMQAFGYTDWTLADDPVILSEHCTEYIDRLIQLNSADPVRASSSMSPALIKNLESASRDGKHIAMTRLALLLIEGKHTEADPSRAIELLREAARLGNVGAMRELGKHLLREGNGRPEEACDWLERAVEKEDHESCYYLAEAHFAGRGRPRNVQLAAHFHELGAKRGSRSCMRQLARLYRSGKGVPRDEAAASYWEQKAESKK